MKYLNIVLFFLLSFSAAAQEVPVIERPPVELQERIINSAAESEAKRLDPNQHFSYKIGDIEYSITGRTRAYSLKLALDIDSEKLFSTKQEIDAYIADRERVLQNQRVLQSGIIVPVYREPDEQGIILVDLEVITTDTWNIIGVPYPKYDSNTGFELKLKLKDYNFLGSMQTLNLDMIFEYIDKENYYANGFRIGGNIDFKIPFSLWGVATVWDLKAGISWPVNNVPDITLKTGLGFSIPFKFVSIDFGIEQGFRFNAYDGDGLLYPGDSYYFTENASLSFPFILARIPHWGKIIWRPNFSVSYNWDFNGIQNSDLMGPSFSAGHAFSFGRVDWVENHRKGFDTYISNSYTYNPEKDAILYPSINLTLSGFMATSKAGISGRLKWFGNFHNFAGFGNAADSVASDIRGVRDNRITTDTAFVFNLDIPISIFSTDWVKWFGQSWMAYLDFELQFSPFFDAALIHNLNNGRFYDFRDGFYGTGFEIRVYPAKLRSVTGRISVGMNPFKVVHFSDLELYIGIGLLY